MRSEDFTLRPAPAGQIIMACIGLPICFASFGGGIFIASGGDLLTAAYALPLFLLGCWCLLEVSTVRLHLTAERLWLERYWHTRWSISRDRAELRPGRVGDVSLLPGLHVVDRITGAKVGEIISGQFRTGELEQLASALHPPGSVR